MKRKKDRRSNKTPGTLVSNKSRVNRRAEERLAARTASYERIIKATTEPQAYKKPGALKRH